MALDNGGERPPATCGEANVRDQFHHAPRGAWRSGFGCRRNRARRRRQRAGADAVQDLRPGSRRVARRLVLAARGRPSGGQGSQGVHANPDRPRRALASAEQGHQPRHPHHRHRQRLQMGRPERRLPGAALLRRLAGLGRARTGGRSCLVGRLPRRVQAGGRPARRGLRIRVQPQGAAGGARQGRGRARRAAARRRSMSTRRTAPGSPRR